MLFKTLIPNVLPQFAGYYAAIDERFYDDTCLSAEIVEGGVDIVPQTQLQAHVVGLVAVVTVDEILGLVRDVLGDAPSLVPRRWRAARPGRAS